MYTAVYSSLGLPVQITQFTTEFDGLRTVLKNLETIFGDVTIGKFVEQVDALKAGSARQALFFVFDSFRLGKHNVRHRNKNNKNVKTEWGHRTAQGRS